MVECLVKSGGVLGCLAVLGDVWCYLGDGHFWGALPKTPLPRCHQGVPKTPPQCFQDAPRRIKTQSFASRALGRTVHVTGFHSSSTHFETPPLASRAPGRSVDGKSLAHAAFGRRSTVEPLASTALRSRRASRSLAKTGLCWRPF